MNQAQSDEAQSVMCLTSVPSWHQRKLLVKRCGCSWRVASAYISNSIHTLTLTCTQSGSIDGQTAVSNRISVRTVETLDEYLINVKFVPTVIPCQSGSSKLTHARMCEWFLRALVVCHTMTTMAHGSWAECLWDQREQNRSLRFSIH
ncbi:Short chain dehydrogenase [Anopheles sinensis]|uniref:Short chain dehydrogenase n=1 Tax=Anopheles sinensis TaxID=74873 RepID=A0A084VNN8_ANOSI|nr:Short chain dehydrogenase [Anopheles sinensis]